MKKRTLILVCYIFNIINVFSQKHDNVWIVGYSGNNKPDYPDFGTTFLTFDKDTLKVAPKFIDIDFRETNVTMSDKNGKMLFTTNAFKIYGIDGKIVKNGDTLGYKDGWYTSGLRHQQGVLALPIPERENEYMLFYGSNEVLFYYYPFYYAIFDASKGTNGTMVEKNKIIIKDSVGTGKITAVKHGNGRDWWIHVAKTNNVHYWLLLTSKGVSFHHKQVLGAKYYHGVGQAVFSPDGSRFVESRSESKKTGQDLDIYDVDRCNGMLSNYKQIHFDTSNFIGCGISPNSRFMYFSNGWQILQYDLDVDDIKSSEVIAATWDGFIDFSMTGFDQMQLAPDRKIYVATNGSTHYMHTIEKPDEKGLACQVKQRSVKLFNYNSWSIPNHPNYRLGALKGSPCDTLHGVAVEDIEQNQDILIAPNPSNDYVKVSWNSTKTMNVVLSDILGRELIHQTLAESSEVLLDVSTISNGIYTISVNSKDNSFKSINKIIIQH